ncbi:STAS domain-containing protein [Sporomusa aerivorans]|uniref:STAS domain-containing protein n=1 Tax=Sporomusa aerivorans TaxID=204936 RepID=UPI00352BCEB4
MKQHFSIDGSQVNIKLIGQMFDEDAADLRAKLSAYIDQGYNTYILDMGELDYIDSSGIAVLISVNKRLESIRGHIVLKHLKGVVKELFTITHLITVFDVRSDSENG